MRIVVVSVGRPRSGPVAEAIAEYEARASRYWPFEAVDVREESARSRAPADVRDREAERIIERVPAGSVLVACDPGGATMDSGAFAQWLVSERDAARSVTFAIGGALGLGAAVVTAASRRLSLAPWTLPHELARLVLAEQLYRAGTIARGEPYHK